MTKSSSISRRIGQSIPAFARKNYEEAFLHLFPAIDKTAKRRYAQAGVGERIKKFLRDETYIITGIATNNILDVSVDGMDLAEALYKFGRTSISHEGELDERLIINETGIVEIGTTWNLPAGYIIGMIISVVAAPENHAEQLDINPSIDLFEKTFFINELWGNRAMLEEQMCKLWDNPSLFSRNSHENHPPSNKPPRKP